MFYSSPTSTTVSVYFLHNSCHPKEINIMYMSVSFKWHLYWHDLLIADIAVSIC